MPARSRVMGREVMALVLAVLIAPALAPYPQNAYATTTFADPAFERVWSHCDRPVDERAAARSWTWGPEAFYTGYEPYLQGPGGQHLVSYFDKSRMEINDPSADRGAEWFVTNGLLVVDMIAGQIQQGDSQFAPATPPNIPVAGDTAASLNAPTYASLARVASLKGDNRAPNRVGQQISEGLGKDGRTGVVVNLSGFAKYGAYEPTLGHNIADVFWTFMNQRGPTVHDGRYVQNDLVVDWLFAMGYPITEPYWIQISVQAQERWVLMQAFQRRILTYSPYNPEGWKVEMGNVGRAYYDWRYAGRQPAPTATPAALAPAIGLEPASGDTTTQITITGRGFPPYAAVLLGVEQPQANYFRSLGTAAARQDGTFSAKVTLPSDAARFGEVTITAAANAGAVRATARFKLSFGPTITVTPHEVVPNGTVYVQGEGFPAGSAVNVGATFNNRDVEWLSRTRADSGGDFSATVAIGNRAVGSTFRVVATAEGGIKATAPTAVRVIAQPALQVIPSSGPTGVNVTLRGSYWPANRQIAVGVRAADSETEAWVADLVMSDAAGNFSREIFISPSFAGKNELRLIATDGISTIRLEAAYRVVGVPTPTPVARTQTVAVSPSVLAIGQPATVTGSNWQAGGAVSIGVGRPDFGVEEWLTTVQADGSRNFAATITLGSRWANAGQLVVTAAVPGGKSATTVITVIPPGRRITPAGLPMNVGTYSRGGSTLVRIGGQGWQPGAALRISVVSVDGAVSSEVGTAVVNSEGAFNADFYAAGSWAGRADLGVRATTLNGAHYSLRYLPITTMAKVSGTSGTYEIKGFNWAAGVRMVVMLHVDGEEDYVLGSAATDANGAFALTVTPQRVPGALRTEIRISAKDQPYSAAFDF